MAVEKVIAEAQAAKASGATCFAWAPPGLAARQRHERRTGHGGRG